MHVKDEKPVNKCLKELKDAGISCWEGEVDLPPLTLNILTTNASLPVGLTPVLADEGLISAKVSHYICPPEDQVLTVQEPLTSGEAFDLPVVWMLPTECRDLGLPPEKVFEDVASDMTIFVHNETDRIVEHTDADHDRPVWSNKAKDKVNGGTKKPSQDRRKQPGKDERTVPADLDGDLSALPPAASCWPQPLAADHLGSQEIIAVSGKQEGTRSSETADEVCVSTRESAIPAADLKQQDIVEKAMPKGLILAVESIHQ